MLDLRCGKEDASFLEVFQDLRICADGALVVDFSLGGLAAHAGKLAGLGLHAALAVHHLHERRIVLSSDSRVVLTKGRGDVDDAGTVCHRDIVITVDKEGLLMLRIDGVLCALVQRLVLLVLQVLAPVGLEDLIGRCSVLCKAPENRVRKSSCNVIGKAVSGLYLLVLILRVHAERDVGGKGPGGSGPGEEVGILSLCLEADDSRPVLDGLVALRHLMRGERGPTARAVGDDLEALVQKALLPDLL